MALPLKSGADLYNQQALRLRLHNLGADPLEVGEGLIYYNTSTGLNTSGKARIYTGAGWKTLAFSEDLDVASNADFLALKSRVDAFLDGEADSDSILENLKEIQAFLDNYSSATDLTAILATKANKTDLANYLPFTGGMLYNGVDNSPLVVKGVAEDAYIGFLRGNNTSLGSIGINANLGPVYWDSANNVNRILLHSGNVGEYALPLSGGTITRKDRHQLLLTNPNSDGASGLWIGGQFEVFNYGGLISYNRSSDTIELVNFAAYINSLKGIGAMRITADNKVQVGDVNWTEGYIFDVIHSGNIGSYNAGSATKLQDDTAFTAWGQTFFENGKPKNVDGYFRSDKNDFRMHYNTNTLFLQAASTALILGEGTRETIPTYICGNAIYLNNASATTMLINSAGNVTIGGSDLAGTSAKLYVDGHTFINSYLALANNNGIYFKDTEGVIRSQLYVDPNNDVSVGYGAVQTSGITSIYGTGIKFLTSTSAERMRITNDGNVGIGTTDPTEKLSVNGNITATGEISCGGAGEEGTSGSGASVFQHVFTPSASTSVTILHNLGTEDIVITLYEKDATSGLWSVCLTDIEIVSANEVTITFGSTSSQDHKVVIMGGVI